MLKQIILRLFTRRPLVALLTFVLGMVAVSSKSCVFSPAQKTDEAKPVLIIPAPALNVASEQSNAEDVPQKIKDLEITPVSIKEENTRSLFKIDIEYPQIKSPKTPQQRRFNRYVKRMFAREVQSFKAFCSKYRRYPNGKLRDMEYSLGGNYEVLYGDKNLLSVKIAESSFTGYLNSDWYIVSINYDLRKGRLWNLADLFIPKSNFLKVLSELSFKELEKKIVSCRGSDVDMRGGTAPKKENYEHWNIMPTGIKVTFGEYQVGPGCLGIVDVDIPYSLLRDKLSHKGPVNDLMNLKPHHNRSNSKNRQQRPQSK